MPIIEPGPELMNATKPQLRDQVPEMLQFVQSLRSTPCNVEAIPANKVLSYEMFSDVELCLDQNHLIEDLLTTTAMSILYGASNTGKTFVALKLGYCVASGTPFCGKRVEQGGVVYVAAEAGQSIRNRVVALRQHYGVTDHLPLAIVAHPIDLLRAGADTDALIALIAKAQNEMGVPVRMVVIDTLSRALSGGDENSPVDMGAFIKNTDKIRHAVNAHLMVVHHSGKDKTKGARGHSLLRAAVDTELEVTANKTIKTTKQRDMDYGREIGFNLLVVTLGTDQRGKTISSCVLSEFNQAAAEIFGNRISPAEAALPTPTKVMLNILRENSDAATGMSMEGWASLCMRTNVISGSENSETLQRIFRRGRTALRTAGLTHEDEVNQIVTLVADKADNSADNSVRTVAYADLSGQPPIGVSGCPPV